MKKTYAYNSIIIGFLVGLLAWVSTENMALGILAFVGVSVVGFIAIRFLEKGIDKGIDAAANAVTNAYQNYKAEKNAAAQEQMIDLDNDASQDN